MIQMLVWAAAVVLALIALGVIAVVVVIIDIYRSGR